MICMTGKSTVCVYSGWMKEKACFRFLSLVCQNVEYHLIQTSYTTQLFILLLYFVQFSAIALQSKALIMQQTDFTHIENLSMTAYLVYEADHV